MTARVSVLAFGLAIAVAELAAAPSARAGDGFRCESGLLVNVGDLTYEVQKKCGDPDQVTERVEKRIVRRTVRRWVDGVVKEVTEEQEIDVPINEWVYDMGSQRLIRLLLFENDRLVRVSTGRRGGSPR